MNEALALQSHNEGATQRSDMGLNNRALVV